LPAHRHPVVIAVGLALQPALRDPSGAPLQLPKRNTTVIETLAAIEHETSQCRGAAPRRWESLVEFVAKKA
jgi:hypothetical protein